MMKREQTQGNRIVLNMFNLSLRLDVYIKMRKQSAEGPHAPWSNRGPSANDILYCVQCVRS